MMRILIITFFLLFSIQSLWAQEQLEDNKLLVKYSEREIAKLRIDNPEEYNYLLYYADHRGIIGQMPPFDLSDSIPEVSFDLDDMNFLTLDLEPYLEKAGNCT